MKLITIDQARAHVRSDGDDDEFLTTLCNAAEAACASLANRDLFATTTELNTAKAGVAASMRAAYTAYDSALVSASAEADARVKDYLNDIAKRNLNAATLAADRIVNGLAIDAATGPSGAPAKDDIISAVLMTVAHFYRNRENVVTGQGAAAVEIPMSAQNIMMQHRWIGPL
jgi:hypothetical protein